MRAKFGTEEWTHGIVCHIEYHAKFHLDQAGLTITPVGLNRKFDQFCHNWSLLYLPP